MSTKTIENFFSDKSLVIPAYQRDYAWRERNINDLFGDIEEALETGGGHYLGTFILSQHDRAAPAKVVDGQQRLTTLTLVLKALIDAMEDPAIQQAYRSTFIRHPIRGQKLRVLGINEQFFNQMLAGEGPEPESGGQERLTDAYLWIRQRVQALQTRGGQELIQRWLECVSQMEVLEFTEPNEGRAIRMFQSVNDRGVPLSRMDIVKSLLIYYSNRYLAGKLDNWVADQFGSSFRSFTRIKKLGSEPGFEVRNVSRDNFREDDVLRYHYFAFDSREYGGRAGADFNANTDAVLESFLKPTLQELRTDRRRLLQFIQEYTSDLSAFFSGLEELLDSARVDRSKFLLFAIQDLSATLYPITIRLHLRGWLQEVVTTDYRTLLDVLELVDLRVFKIRGTNPQADVYRITRALPVMPPSQVAGELDVFCRRFMPDTLLRSRIADEDVYRNLGLVRILAEEEDSSRRAIGDSELGLNQLVGLNRVGLTVEHILAQAPAVDLSAYGFDGADAFEEARHKIGHLVLLEGPLNSRCNNRSVEEKMSTHNLYLASQLQAVRALAAAHTAMPYSFNKVAVELRGARLAELVLGAWPLFNTQVHGETLAV